MPDPPAFLDSPLLQHAYRDAAEAYRPCKDGDARLDHAISVARLLAKARCGEELIAAGLLHDVFEDTGVTPDQLRERFGQQIADLVGSVTENDAIGDYVLRKAALRGQVAETGRDAATIFAADKLARLQGLAAAGERPKPEKLLHYRKTVALLASGYPDLPFLDELHDELAKAGAPPPGVAHEQRMVNTRDGAPIAIRPITPSDAELLAHAYEQLGDDSRRRRFLAAPARLSAEDLRYLTDVDGQRHDALVAIDPATGGLVGEARFVREPGRRDTAEVAVVVVDAWQGRGVGTALLTELTKRAREHGLRRYKAIVSADNHAVLEALAKLGGEATNSADDQIELELDFPSEGLPERLVATLGWAARGQIRLLGTIARRMANVSPV
jgi:RimJ/RimL family protein N-acetyltransferase